MWIGSASVGESPPVQLPTPRAYNPDIINMNFSDSINAFTNIAGDLSGFQ